MCPASSIGNSSLSTRYSDFVLIAGVESPLVVYMRKDTPPGINVAADLMKAQEFKALSLNAQNTNTLNQALALDLLGIKYQAIPAYRGLKEVETAILQNIGQTGQLFALGLERLGRADDGPRRHAAVAAVAAQERRATRAARRCPTCRRSRSSTRRFIPASRSPAISTTRCCARSAIRSSRCSAWR